MEISPSDCAIYMITHLLSKRIAVDPFCSTTRTAHFSEGIAWIRAILSPKHESLSEKYQIREGHGGSIYQIEKEHSSFLSRLNYLLWFGDIGAGHDESAFLF